MRHSVQIATFRHLTILPASPIDSGIPEVLSGALLSASVRWGKKVHMSAVRQAPSFWPGVWPLTQFLL